MKTIYSTDEVCEFLGIGKTSLYKLINNKKIDAIKIGRLTRISSESLQSFIKSAPAYASEVGV